MSNSKDFLGKKVEIVIDRPIGSKHPEYGYKYPINAGFIPKTKMADGEELDAFILGVNIPLEKFSGTCIAIINRTNDNEDKLIVVPEGQKYSETEIEKLVNFQEKWFKHKIIRN